jgi:ferredoxin
MSSAWPNPTVRSTPYPRGSTDGSTTVKVHIDPERCQGHGRCYDLAPDLFGEDDEGYGTVLADGVVPPEDEHEAHRAVANCPEHAIELIEEKLS